jgi:tetratricopeptide (TPR) repeat protein
VYAAVAANAEPHLTGPDRARWLDKLSEDHANLRLAQRWAADNEETDMAFEMASSLWRFFHMRGHLFAARELLDELLVMSGGSPVARAKALEAAGGVAYWSGDMVQARDLYSEALAILQQLGEPVSIAYGLYNLGFVQGYGEDFESGRELLNEALAIFVDVDDKAGIAAVTWGLGDAWAASGDFAEAQACFARSITAFEQLDDPFGLGWALFTNGEVSVRLGEFDSAREHLERGLRLFQSGDMSAVVLFLAAFASLAIATGDEARAARLAGAMTGLRDETGTELVSVVMFPVSGVDQATLDALAGEFAAAYAEGRSMTAVDAVAYALREDEAAGERRDS